MAQQTNASKRGASQAGAKNVNLPLTKLKGIGPALAKTLAKLGLHNIDDLYFHLPFRYEDRTKITPINRLQVYNPALIEGEIISSSIIMGRRRSLMVVVDDGSARCSLRFFHFNQAQKKALAKGLNIRAFGEVRPGSSGAEMYHPEYKVFRAEPPALEQSLTPIYSVTEGISQQRIRSCIEQAFAKIDQQFDDLLPSGLLKAFACDLPDLKSALHTVHFPRANNEVQALLENEHPAQKRLALEELLAYQLTMAKSKAQLQQERAEPLPANAQFSALEKNLLAKLSFTLTQAQQKVLSEIYADIEKGSPMNRLLQGDVGSGKTVVAALAALRALASNKQVALMAPTEILAEQHYLQFTQWFAGTGVEVVMLNGALGVAKKRKALQMMASGQAHIIVGTHALFQPDVLFDDLALCIIDEQHRFGVDQRRALKEKAKHSAHQLLMTATPIPRTLAMSVYGNLEQSVIDELPPGRTPIKTAVIGQDKRSEVVERIRLACTEGKQVYWVCTLIEESESLQCEAAEDAELKLQEALGPYKVGLIHGRMKAADKQAVMQRFVAAELDVLVATTVIEVGVNVPNASLMVIENAERLGLAQLHQLRGRVGRGEVESYCVLLYQTPLSHIARERLQTMRESTDGFYIAERDLDIRGPGEVLGTRQTGELEFRFADLLRDESLLPLCHDMASSLFVKRPDIADKLIARWHSHVEAYLSV